MLWSKPKGYLLVELFVAFTVIALLSIVVAQTTISLVRFYKRQMALVDVQRRSTIGIELLREAAKGAEEVLASRTINGIPYVSGTSTVAFVLPAIDSDGDLLAGTDYIGFHRDSSNPLLLKQNIDADPSSVRNDGISTIATFVDVFHIRYNTSTPADADHIEFYLETRSQEQPEIYSPLMTNIELKNK